MEWIKENPTAFTFVIIFGVCVILLLVSTIITYLGQKHFERVKRDEINTTFGIEVDLKSNRVVYFDRRDFSRHRTISLESFYELLHKKDTMRLKLWLEELKTNFDFTDRYIETEIVNKNTEGFFLLLKAVGFNEENQRVYIEGFQLSSMNPSQGRKRNADEEYSVIKRSQIESIYNTLKNRAGFVFSIKFFYRNNDVIHDASVEKSVLYRLKNEIYAYAANEKNRYVYDEYDEQIYYHFTLTNERNGSSNTKVNNYLGGDNTSSRFYKNNIISIVPSNDYEITSVVFNATTENYAKGLNDSTWTNATSSISGSVVTVIPNDGSEEISATIGATCGFTSVVLFGVLIVDR